MSRIKRNRFTTVIGALCLAACAQPANPGTQHEDCPAPPSAPKAPAPTWTLPLTSNLYLLPLAIDAAPADAQPGVEGSVVAGIWRGEARIADTRLVDGAVGDSLFVARLDDAGRLLWAKRLGDGEMVEHPNRRGLFSRDDLRVRLQPDGGIVVGGSFFGKAVLGQSASEGQEVTTKGGWDVFVVRYRPDGAFDWWADTGSPQDDHLTGVALLPGGGVAIVGSFRDTVPLMEGLALDAKGGSDVFVARTTSDGKLENIRTFGSNDDDAATDLASDGEGNLYVAGTFRGELAFSESTSLASVGDADAFLVKLDAQLAPVWSQTANGVGEERGGHVVLDAAGNVFWTMRVGRGARVGEALFASGGAVVAKVSADGHGLWTKAVEGSFGGRVPGVSAGADGELAVFGDGRLLTLAPTGSVRWERTGTDAADVRAAAIRGGHLHAAGFFGGPSGLGYTRSGAGADAITGVVAQFPLEP